MNLVQCVLLSVLGDVIYQGCTAPLAEYKSSRSLTMAAWGFVSTILTIKYLDFINSRKFSKDATLDAAGKATFNQLFFTSVLCFLFMAFQKLIQGGYTEVTKFVSSYPEFMPALYKLWYVALPYWGVSDFLNLKLMPTEFQLIFNAVVGLVFAVVTAFFLE
jgi:hypothetical protein